VTTRSGGQVLSRALQVMQSVVVDILSSSAVHGILLYSGRLWRTVGMILRSEGLGGLYRGLGATLARDTPTYGVRTPLLCTRPLVSFRTAGPGSLPQQLCRVGIFHGV
jgi:transmembrane carrier protein